MFRLTRLMKSGDIGSASGIRSGSNVLSLFRRRIRFSPKVM